MSIQRPPRRLGAFFALLASALLVVSLILPLFVITLGVQDTTEMTMSISAWGSTNDGPGINAGYLFQLSPAHAFPVLFATLLLVAATVVAFVRAGSVAGPSAALWLTMAAAFAAGVAITVIPQLTNWYSMFQQPYGAAMGMRTSASIGLGFWSLAAGAVLAVGGAALTAMPVRRPQPPVIEAPPAGVEPTGIA